MDSKDFAVSDALRHIYWAAALPTELPLYKVGAYFNKVGFEPTFDVLEEH